MVGKLRNKGVGRSEILREGDSWPPPFITSERERVKGSGPI